MRGVCGLESLTRPLTYMKLKWRERRQTNASASIRLEDDEHCDITSESIAMLSHFTNDSSNTRASIESLKITQVQVLSALE